MINNTIKLLMISDIFVMTGFGLTEPVFTLFIKDSVVGGTVLAIGLASALFLVVKSCIQLPFSHTGVGGAANKNDRRFLGFAPRELVERGRGASVIRQNPADFVRNSFELCPTNTANRKKTGKPLLGLPVSFSRLGLSC